MNNMVPLFFLPGNDLLPRYHCCFKSNDEYFCNLYREKRPDATTIGYRPPGWGESNFYFSWYRLCYVLTGYDLWWRTETMYISIPVLHERKCLHFFWMKIALVHLIQGLGFSGAIIFIQWKLSLKTLLSTWLVCGGGSNTFSLQLCKQNCSIQCIVA